MKKFYSNLIVAIFVLLSLVLTPALVAAQENATASSSPKSSFELFWPLSAGTTIDSSWYFLKIFKENLRGMFIFGAAQKANYAVMLAIKRVLEAEKLNSLNKKELVDRTLDKALEQFEMAQKDIEEASSKNSLDRDSVNTIKPRLSNLIDFLPTLASNKANLVLEKVRELNTKL